MPVNENGNDDILNYERPSLTADCALFRISVDAATAKPVLQVRLVRRPNAPECGKLALIGAFVPVEERIDDVLTCCVSEKAGIDDFWFEQLYTFDTPGRDERWRVISVAHIGIVAPDTPERLILPADWYDIDVENRILRSPVQETVLSFDDLAFDHADILETALERLRGKALWTDIAFRFLPETFTISQLKGVLEVLAQKTVNNVKRDFKRYLAPVSDEEARNLIGGAGQGDGETPKRPAHRPPALYRFAGTE